MIPLVCLSVAIENPFDREASIEASTNIQEVVNFLLGMNCNDYLYFYSMFKESEKFDDFEIQLKKFIEENRTEKLNINYDMKLRIYTKDNNREFIISLEGVNTAKKFIQYGLKLTKIWNYLINQSIFSMVKKWNWKILKFSQFLPSFQINVTIENQFQLKDTFRIKMAIFFV